jgi:hypothetical protein
MDLIIINNPETWKRPRGGKKKAKRRKEGGGGGGGRGRGERQKVEGDQKKGEKEIIQ